MGRRRRKMVRYHRQLTHKICSSSSSFFFVHILDHFNQRNPKELCLCINWSIHHHAQRLFNPWIVSFIHFYSFIRWACTQSRSSQPGHIMIWCIYLRVYWYGYYSHYWMAVSEITQKMTMLIHLRWLKSTIINQHHHHHLYAVSI